MPATSLVSAVRGGIVPEETASAPLRVARRAPALLWREAAGAALNQALAPALHWMRGRWLYRTSLRGPVPDRFLFHPDDVRLTRLEDADGFFRGRFRLANQMVQARDGSVFDADLPGPDYAAALHGFDWLPHLEAAGGDLARDLARDLAGQWLARNAHYRLPAWLPEVTSRRFFNLFAHGEFFLAGAPRDWRARFFRGLRDQAQMLARTVDETPDGMARLSAAAATVLAGLCVGDPRSNTKGLANAKGLARLAFEIERQILPDGGHISRSPAALLEAFCVLSMVQQTLDHLNREVQPALIGALDRMAPMLRFFREGDGGLALFHGGGEEDTRIVAAALQRDDSNGRPLAHAPYSGFQRLARGRSLVLLDAGVAPSGALSVDAHASCLAFEMSAGTQRLIVNCGVPVGKSEDWSTALRATAAHSTLTLANASSAVVLTQKHLSRLLGPRLVRGPLRVETRRSENADGITIEASHDGYAADFGFIHRRCVTLAADGLSLVGSDHLIPSGKGAVSGHGGALPFAIRFHVHPDVRLSLAQGGGSVIFKLPSGEGWRFRCGGGVLTVEESIYFGNGAPRRAEQLVIGGEAGRNALECAWLLEQVRSA
jgi:uncharacterized heparinase superfamily protein